MNNQYYNLTKLVENLTNVRLIEMTNGASFTENHDNFAELCLFSRWLGFIQLSHQSFRMTFKCHFDENLMLLMESQRNSKSSIRKCQEEVKELCNLIVGGMKALLPELRIGVSLPMVLSGFDEIFLRPKHGDLELFHVWLLEVPQCKVYFSIEIIEFDKGSLKDLNEKINPDNFQQNNEVELF